MSTSIKPDIRLLVTSAGRRVELLRTFRQAAQDLGIGLKIFACDQRPEWSSACHEADLSFAVPPATSPGYIDALLHFCDSATIDLIVPTIDPELLPLAQARAQFAERGAHVSVSAPELVAMARDKQHTADYLHVHHIPSPRTAPLEAVIAAPDGWPWPVIVKPTHGSASRSVRIAENAQALTSIVIDEPFIVQERLDGQEYTVNLFFDRAGTLRCAIPHERLQVRGGEVEKGITRRDPRLLDLAARLGDALPGARGALCFQAMMDAQGNARLFEINARFGGGYPLAHWAGAQFSRWLLEEAANLPLSASDEWQEGAVMLRYDAAMFVTP